MLTRILDRVVQVWRKAPLLLLASQLPEASVDLVEKALGRTSLGQSPILLALTVLPYFWIASAASFFLTAHLVISLDLGRDVSFRDSWNSLIARLPALTTSSLLAGVVVLVGIPLLLPGVYFMACYLFVPACLATDPGDAPASVLLARSKKVARQRMGLILPLTTGFLVVGLGLFFLEEALVSAGMVDALAVLCKMMVAVPLGACVYVAVSDLFLALTSAETRQRESLDETPRRSA